MIETMCVNPTFQATVKSLSSILKNLRLTLLVVFFLALFLRGTLSEHVFGVTRSTTGEAESKVVKLIIEGILTLNLAYFALWNAHWKRFGFPPPLIFASCYLAWSMLSGAITSGDSIYAGVKYARYTSYAFLLYWMVWNQRFSKRELKIINILLGALFLLQIVASVVRVLFFERVEWRVGTMMVSYGELAAVFPLFALCYVMGHYFYVRNSLSVMLIGFSFALVGYASDKRAIFFLMPLFLLVCFAVFFFQKKKINVELVRRFLIHITLCLFIALPFWVYGIDSTKGISSGNKKLRFLDKVLYALQYAQEYEQGERGDGGTSGRISTSINVLTNLGSWSSQHILFGRGPRSFTDKSGEREKGAWDFKSLGIAYGIVGWSRDTIAVGLPGMFFLVVAYALVFRDIVRFQNIKSLSLQGKAIHFGTVSGFIVLFYTYFFYGGIVVGANPITFVLLFYAALFCSPVNLSSQGMLQSRKRLP